MSGLLNPSRTADALRLVEEERARQDRKWGDQDHPPALWMSILTEEVGEAAREANAITFAQSYPLQYVDTPYSVCRFRAELVQIAAVAVAAVEKMINLLDAPICGSCVHEEACDEKPLTCEKYLERKGERP